jgi:Phosphodiester glycosidase/Calcineurin-like phosphoesterase
VGDGTNEQGMPAAAVRAVRASILALCLTMLLLAPSTARAEPLALVDDAETLGPGIRLDHDVYLEPSGFIDRHLVTVDLTRPPVTTDLLSAPSIAQGSALSEQANQAGAVAGVNGDFFDIGNSNAALGFEIQGGELRKSGDRNAGQSFGVGQDRIAQLLNLALQATATWDGIPRQLSGLNESGVPAGGIAAYTPAWGTYSRALLTRPATNTAEVWIADSRVVRPAQPPEGGALPAGTTALVGREAGADALRTLEVGDPVELSYELSPEAARRLQFAVGTDVVLVRDGVQRPDSETSQGAAGNSPAPRTAVGFKDAGRTLMLVTIDGPGGTGRGGVTLPKLASIMHVLGAETAVNLDGGGSTTMVARGLGEGLATVRNMPSDGSERPDPNGVGVFVASGSGRVEDLVISPDGDEARVFPGMHLPMTARAVDDHLTPVALDQDDVRWDASRGDVEDGLLEAPRWLAGSIRLEARVGRAVDDARVRVLGRLHSLELSSRRLSIPDLASSETVTVTGRDAEGFAAPLDPADLELDYDRSVIRITPAAGGLEVTPLRTGSTTVEVRAGGESASLPVSVGVETVEIYRFDHPDETARWTPNGTAGQPKSLSIVPEGLKLTYAAQRNMGITKVPADTRIEVPGQPLRIRVRLSASVATQFANLGWVDADGTSQGMLIGGPQPGENALEWTLPSDTEFPIRISSVQVIETRTAQQAPGEVVFKSIEADLAPEVDLPAPEPLRPDPLISPDGRFAERDDWTFATLSDVQFTAANQELAKVAIAALARIRRTEPDLVVLNGDIVDTGSAADIDLAREVLEDGGCHVVEVGETPAPSTPETVPCYYVPGNHESYLADGSQGTLDEWVAEFGEPYRTFDHKGTRFVLLNSALGTLRGSGFDQLPMLEQVLDDARRDRDIDNVLVFAHHPVDDPDEQKASQLGDRREVELIKRLLADFRADSGKGVAMIGSHAQIVHTHREEGVPYQVLPSSGKAPYGTPDRGGFTGYMRFALDRHADADEQWLTADVRAFAQQITLDAPEELEDERSAELGGWIVQPSGVLPGTRVAPLTYPMSVHWSGSRCLAIGDGEWAARRAGKVATLDPLTRELTALRPGTVEIRVTNESMRELTDEASLEPVTMSQTVRVVPSHGRDFGRPPECARAGGR